jgi:hypothetical protein
VLNTAKVEKGATVAIFGLGGIGLAAVIGARMSGARASSPSTPIRVNSPSLKNWVLPTASTRKITPSRFRMWSSK